MRKKGRNKRRVLTLTALVSLIFLTIFGCAKGTVPGDMTSSSVTDTEKDTQESVTAESTRETTEETSSSSEEASDETEDTASEEKDTGTETEPSESEGTEESEDESDEPVRFMGLLTDPEIAKINERTLNTPGSNLFDVTREDVVFTNHDVLNLIRSYSFPDTVYYGDMQPTEELRAELDAKRNLGVLTENRYRQVEIQYGIITGECGVKSFPTELRATSSQAPNEFDYFRESNFVYGSGVLVLHYSTGGDYAFVQGNNYAGWIRTDTFALTDKETFLQFLKPDQFLIETHPDLNDPLSRIGVILPFTAKEEDTYQVLFPVRSEEGQLVLEIRSVTISPDNPIGWHEGFMTYSKEALVELSKTYLDLPYGYSDEYNRYDCSSYTGSLYLLFGFRMPRNTNIMHHFGGSVVNAEKVNIYETLDAHPGALVLMPTHVMMYIGQDENGKHLMIHETIYEGTDRVIISTLEDMVNGSGRLYTDILTTILYPDLQRSGL